MHDNTEDSFLRRNFSKTLKDSLHSTQSISGRASILTYANRQYPSATDALHAYISDFDNTQSSSPYKRTVEDLLSPKSVLLQTVERSLATGVRDTRAESHRHAIKKLIDQSYEELLRADLEREKAKHPIQTISSSDLSSLTPDRSLQYPSLTSLSTDVLLSQASQSVHNHNVGFTSDAQNYLNLSHSSKTLSPLQESYRANAIQLKSLQSNVGKSSGILKKRPSPDRKKTHREVSFTRSTNSRYLRELQNQDGLFKSTIRTSTTSPEYKEAMISVPNRKTSFDRHFKTRRKADSVLSGGRKVPSWIEDVDMSLTLDPHINKSNQKAKITSKIIDSNTKSNASEISGQRNVPSWIEDISMSEVQSTGEGRSQIGRAPPSWINGMNGSEVSSVIPAARQLPFYDLNVTKGSNANTDRQSTNKLSQPGLTYQDLRSPDKENHPNPTNHNTGRAKMKSSAEINRQVRNSMAKQSVRKVLPSSPVLKQRISSDMMSMTTDDLILAPSTGRGLPESRSMEDLRITLKQMDASPTRTLDRGTTRSNKTRLRDTQRRASEEVWQRSAAKSAVQINDPDRSRLYVSDLYLSPRKYAPQSNFAVHKQDLYPPHFKGDSPKANWMSNDRPPSSQRYSRVPNWRTDMHHTGRFTKTREFEQRVIDRAEKILGSPLTHPLRSLQTQSPNTEDILDGDRSWEKTLPYKPLRPVYTGDEDEHRRTQIIDRFLEDCLNSNSTSPRLTFGDQPGTVEALKNMLFTIQSVAVANDLTEDDDTRTVEDEDFTPRAESEDTIGTEEEGSKSLKRAMEHLSRLKYLVQSDSEHTLQQDTD
ncbi:uncharacterized protein [Antedon mediterranea]|uniref:uncharacterized protein isoform X2 n=1 Tax=Antedon mediterranea TaxID=105859 RepID=UPI003AF7F96F